MKAAKPRLLWTSLAILIGPSTPYLGPWNTRCWHILKRAPLQKPRKARLDGAAGEARRCNTLSLLPWVTRSTNDHSTPDPSAVAGIVVLGHPHIHVCMYVCMYACMHVCMYACMHVCMYACMHVCMYACMHVYMYACMHVCMYACIHVCMYACMHVCMYACIHVCMYACM